MKNKICLRTYVLCIANCMKSSVYFFSDRSRSEVVFVMNQYPPPVLDHHKGGGGSRGDEMYQQGGTGRPPLTMEQYHPPHHGQSGSNVTNHG